MDEKQRNKNMLNLLMKLVVAEASDQISCGCILSEKELLLAELTQDEPDTVGLKFDFGTVVLFDDGTWKLEE